MKDNIFEVIYSKVQDFHKKYSEAQTLEDKKKVRSDYNALMEDVEKHGEHFCRIWREYESSKDCGNAYIDINDVVWDKDAEKLISCMRENGIDKFTFSSRWSGSVETAWLFQKAGCKLEGLVEINSRIKDYMNDEYEKVHGYLFSVC